LARKYLEEIGNIFQTLGFEEKKVFHEVEGLIPYFEENPDGIFLDVGGEISQIFLVRDGRLENIDEFEIGGKFFSQILSEKLGLREQEARILKERYSKKELSKESSERIKEIFWPPTQDWFKNLKSKLKEIKSSSLVWQNIILFGGGSQLADIKEILKEGNWEDFSIERKPNVKSLLPFDFKIIADKTKNLNNPQYTPSLLLWYSSPIGRGSGKPFGCRVVSQRGERRSDSFFELPV
jgi:cell division ATPase FtsA